MGILRTQFAIIIVVGGDTFGTVRGRAVPTTPIVYDIRETRNRFVAIIIVIRGILRPLSGLAVPTAVVEGVPGARARFASMVVVLNGIFGPIRRLAVPAAVVDGILGTPARLASIVVDINRMFGTVRGLAVPAAVLDSMFGALERLSSPTAVVYSTFGTFVSYGPTHHEAHRRPRYHLNQAKQGRLPARPGLTPHDHSRLLPER